MAIDIKAPTFPESVADGTIATWHKQPGEAVSRDELIADIETDKVVLEIVAPADGALSELLKQEGEVVESEEVIARFEKGSAAGADVKSTAGAGSSPAAAEDGSEKIASPAAKKLASETGVDLSNLEGSGRGGRITKEDVASATAGRSKTAAPAPAASAVASDKVKKPASSEAESLDTNALLQNGRVERRVPMTRLRAKVAERLLDASQSTAMLTTFNEVNMQPVINLRNKYKDMFERVHNGTRLGFMSLFVRASVEALKRFPAVNASIDGNDIVYHGYQDIGVAVSTERGLVVPVLRDADHMRLADIEDKIREFGLKAREGKLSIDDMQGGTFTVTNGGVFGSLMSTPILNPPQTGILGMHKIQDRPMAVDGEVRILPMMYLALSYDHRLIDGKDAVQFLVTVKDMIEDPARILLDI